MQDQVGNGGGGRSIVDRALWVRWFVAALAGYVVFAVTPADWPASVRFLAAWDCALVAALALPWWLIFHADPVVTRARAQASDPGRVGLLLISLLASVSSLVLAVMVLDDPEPGAAAISTLGENLLVALAVLGGWMLLQTGYALHYARLYYASTSGDGDPGLQFTDPPPDDLDFAYFAFGIGMAFEPADVTVTTRRMRRTVLAHGVVSFLYNFAIVGLMVSLLAGRI